MININVNIPDSLQQQLMHLGETAGQAAVEAAAYGVEVCLRNHFDDLQQRPRKDGLASAGFWSGARGRSVAEQITSSVAGEEATIAIDSAPLAHKISGGTIRAKDYGHKYLTIPANDQAVLAPQGARSFQTKIMWVEHPDGGLRPALVAASHYATARRGRDGRVRRRLAADPAKAKVGAGDVLYWLVREVTHHPMADAMPTAERVDTAAYDAAQDAINSLLAGGAA